MSGTETEIESGTESEPAGDGRRDRVAIAELVALGWLVAVLGVVAGPIGVGAGLATAATRYALETPSAIGVGTVVLAAAGVGASDASATTVAGIALAFLGLLLAPTVRSDRPLLEGAVALASTAALVGTAWVLARSRPLWVAAGALLCGIALAGYTLHRYELVRLGLVPEGPSPETADQPSETGAES